MSYWPLILFLLDTSSKLIVRLTLYSVPVAAGRSKLAEFGQDTKSRSNYVTAHTAGGRYRPSGWSDQRPDGLKIRR